MAVSLRDVAARAGVSGATVSRVLNGKDEDRIPAQTRDHVRRIAQEMGYRANRFASSLRAGKTRTLGLMISGLANPFFVGVLEAAERAALEREYQVVLDIGPSVRGSYYAHAKLNDWPVDGVIMWAHSDQTLSDVLGGRNLPVVYLGFPRRDGADGVAFGFEEAERALLEYALARGRRHLCYVSAYDFLSGVRPRDPRIAAYQDFGAETGVQTDHFVLAAGEETRAAGMEAGLEIAARPASARPDALICHNDVLAVGVYHGLRRGGLRVPEDIGLTGFDGIEDGQYLDIPLTTVDTPSDALCREAVRLLTARLAGDQEADGSPVIPGRLIPGGTI